MDLKLQRTVFGFVQYTNNNILHTISLNRVISSSTLI